ncbi:DUF2407 C-terminal domain-containing protein [Rhodotorula diobovata]|uniref:DUF2407 C-terminal domain-containing protein n=1 Tax=Rhodotorula diobovata TaxID=5288 RepID=A0A5C5G5B1_9BASI|nr:DUF2407 C-terminal domain-containing protein [Rhodotorula diobovata]
MLPNDSRSLLTDSPHPSSSSSSGAPRPPRTSSSSSRDPFAYPPAAPRRSTLGARKGKGRAVDVPRDGDDDDDEGGRPTAPTGLSFCVRFTDGQTDDLVDLWVGERESVREVKRRLRLLRPKTLLEDDKPRRLRLIQLGRLLPDGVLLVPYTTQLLSKRAQLDQAQGHAGAEALREGIQAVGRGLGKVVRGTASAVARGGGVERDELDKLERGDGDEEEREHAPLLEEEEEEEEEEPQAEQQIWLHCSVGDVEEDDQERAEDTTQITPLQGFDRLRDAGFSDEEIENLRAEFRETHGAGRGEAEAQAGDEDEHQRALEEQWMSGMTGMQEAAGGGEASATGNYYSLLKGISIGFFVPFLPLFFFRTQLFTKRTQMAIVLGIIINLGFGFLRLIG